MYQSIPRKTGLTRWTLELNRSIAPRVQQTCRILNDALDVTLDQIALQAILLLVAKEQFIALLARNAHSLVGVDALLPWSGKKSYWRTS